jgi:hypothetical protein
MIKYILNCSVVTKKESKGRRNLEIKAKCQYENKQIPKRVENIRA